MKGYTGKILHVDLTSGACLVEEPQEVFYRTYIGGACMGAYYVASQVPPKYDALGEKNVLAFTLSPVTGAAVSGTARHCVSCKSPQTGTIASSEAGGFWGTELKFAGFDGLIITGKAAAPVYLWLSDGKWEIRDASAVWGKDTGETQNLIRDELEEPKARIACIGKAGEVGVRYAGIVNELRHFNGRNGMGAVMGSKNLKAIAIRGKLKPEFADPDTIKDMARRSNEIYKSNDFFTYFRKVGTNLNVEGHIPVAGMPTRNWTTGTFEGVDSLTGEVYAETMMDEPGTCRGCIQACKREIKEGITSPEEIDPKYGGPEYETVGMCGSNLGLSSFEEIAAINQLASKAAVDTISMGGVIGFVMECFEKGLITAEQIDGIEARFGSYEAAIQLAGKIVSKDGIGAVLAEGTVHTAEHFGPAAEKLAVHVKNKEFPAHMPHIKASLSLAYALNPFGPDHVSSEHDGAIAGDPPGERLQGLGFYESSNPSELSLEKARLYAYSQRWVSGIDSVSVCQFIFNTWSIFGFEELMELINAATGWKYTIFEFMLLGERRVNIMREFNTREGFTEEQDILPERLFDTPLTGDGPSAGRVIDKKMFLKCREYYYALNGWDLNSGRPGDYKLIELGLGWMRE
jgi:aldehyde:ferredoxin oxidoreductase